MYTYPNIAIYLVFYTAQMIENVSIYTLAYTHSVSHYFGGSKAVHVRIHLLYLVRIEVQYTPMLTILR